jgi:transcriptional regulator with GAF, ATPase, and Fis domain
MIRRVSSLDELSTILSYRVDQTPASNVAFVLTVIEGPDAGKTLRLDAAAPTRAYLGSSPTSDLVIADRQVSRRHLALEVAGARLRATDLGSKNGTFVDGVAMVEVYLSGDETLRLGSSAIRVARVEGAGPAELPYAGSCGSLYGMSREMRRLYPLVERLATSDVPVLIEGETGTGKEVAARTIHQLSRRREGPFVVFDCTATPASLIEGDLFGHEKGSFTGAVTQRKGVFEQAEGGTLLIDEIGDLDLSLQPKLLRALERSELRRVGGERLLHFDVRIVAATRRNLDQEVQDGRFRDDLFHRLVVGRFELPPLRARRGDVALLARRFVQEMQGDPASLTAAVIARWEASQWPGNVRELRNAVARHLALGDLNLGSGPEEAADQAATDEERHQFVADPFDDVIAEGLPLIESRQRMIEAFERRYLTAALASTGGNVTHAARAAGIPRRYFQALRAKRFNPK